uniref:Peptide-N4-(N-acetyl-beta-glucosaminyl)asparagine amidase A n=1 Tax=Anthurium amnicola TaxID=1678845 RepID=A0A1D1Z4A7_9ARAE
MRTPFFPLLLLSLLCCGSSASCNPLPEQNLPDRYVLRRGALPSSTRDGEPREYYDPIHPPVLPMETPVCSLLLLQHHFAHTYGLPPASGNFTPPAPEDCQWNRAVLEFNATSAGEQYDRIAAVWIDGVEVLRTSTAEPTESGVFWSVRKDVTRYASLLTPQDSHHHACGDGGGSRHGDKQPKLRHVWVMLENIVNDVFTGVYHVNVAVHFYDDGANPPSRVRELGEWRTRIPKPPLIGKIGANRLGNPWGKDDDALHKSHHGDTNQERYGLLLGTTADLVLPVSHDRGSSEGFWFRIQRERDVHTAGVKIPKNAYRAILEIYVTAHGDDEFWYSNPPNSYTELLPTKRGNGAFREVYAMIDGIYAGSVMPFPVVFTGGFNPLFWSPVVAIGAFDIPSYNLDVTPFMGTLLKGDSHRITLGVGYGIPFWLVGANLHLWLDPQLSSVSSGFVKHQAQPTSISYSNKSSYMDGLYKLEAERGAHFASWVRSSLGNLTYTIEQQFKYRSTISYERSGTVKEVYSKSKYKTDMKIEEGPNYYIIARLYHKAKYPITLITATEPGHGETYIRTNLSHYMYEKAALTLGKTIFLTSMADSQDAEGWMQVKGHSVLSGSASTLQTYKHNDNGVCYIRKVGVQDGTVLSDESSTDCHFQ